MKYLDRPARAGHFMPVRRVFTTQAQPVRNNRGSVNAVDENTFAIRLLRGGEFRFLENPISDFSPGLIFPADVRRLFKARFKQNLTSAETRLLMQPIAGGHLPDLSKLDGVSYDTRRNQLASIRQKAGRIRQLDVIVIMAVLCAGSLKNGGWHLPA